MSYVEFLQAGIDDLATTHRQGKAIDGFPDRRGMTLRRSRRGDGHVVIYRADERTETIRILHIFHTKQDAIGRMKAEGR